MLLTVLICLTQFVLGLMGVYVSLRPPHEQNHKYWIGGFVAVGLLGIGLTGWLAQRAGSEQKDVGQQLDQINGNTQKNLHAHLDFYTSLFLGASNPVQATFRAGQDISINAIFGVAGLPARNVALGGRVVLVSINARDLPKWEDENTDTLWDLYGKGIVPDRSFGTVNPSPSSFTSESWSTFRLGKKLSRDDVADLASFPPKKAVCLLAKADWRDDSGRYETDNFECAIREAAGVYPWHRTKYANLETKLPD